MIMIVEDIHFEKQRHNYDKCFSYPIPQDKTMVFYFKRVRKIVLPI